MQKLLGLLVVVLFALPTIGSADVKSHTEALDHEVIKVLDEFMDSFNALDINMHRGTYHFPHYRLASGKMQVLNSDSELKRDDLKKFLDGIGWHHSDWDKRQITMRSEKKVHVDTQFTRYRADGSEIGSYESLYILTKERGRWGIKLRSSFAQ